MRMPPSELERLHRAQREVLQESSDYWETVAYLRSELPLISPAGYERPITGSLQGTSERQQIPVAPGSADLLVAEHEYVMAHVEAALQLEHPMARASVRAVPDLRDAVAWVAHNTEHDPASIIDERQRRESVLSKACRMLAPTEDSLKALMPAWVRSSIKEGACISLFAALIELIEWPDQHFTAHQCSGFPTVGEYPDSGVFRAVDKPAERDFDELYHIPHNERVKKSLEREGSDPARREMLEHVTQNTYAERAADVAQGPFTAEEVDARLGAGCWRGLKGFGVEQGTRADGTKKVRRCDNAKSAQTNECVGFKETIATEEASFPILVCLLMARLWPADKPLPPMQHSLDDVPYGYRQMVCAHPETTVVAIYDTRVEAVTYWLMTGHNFGLAAAVLSFNRHSQLLVAVARRVFGVCSAGYFDDYNVTEPVSCGASGKRVLHILHKWMGIPLTSGGEKDIPPAPVNPFLGVVADLSRSSEAIAIMRSKPKRVAAIVVTIGDMLDATRASCAALRELMGKCEYTTRTGSFSRVGRAAMATIRSYIEESGGVDEGETRALPPLVAVALKFFKDVLPLLPPRKFVLRGPSAQPAPIVIYTDARYSPNSAEPAQIGVAMHDPTDSEASGAATWRHASALVPAWLMQQFCYRLQYVGQLEILAAVVAFTSRAEQLRGRDIILFIDNTGALYGISKGYSTYIDSAQLVHVLHCVAAAVDANLWIEYVPTGANLADAPSRGDGRALLELGSAPFDVVWPDLQQDWSEVYINLFKVLNPRPTRSMKRARNEVAQEVASARARRS